MATASMLASNVSVTPEPPSGIGESRKFVIIAHRFGVSLLGIGITFGFFGILGWMLAHGIPHTGGEALLVMRGALGAAFGAVINYYFGSSSW